MLQELLHMIEHTLADSLKLVPFLFLTYLAMEYLEHKAADKVVRLVYKAGKSGPLVGALAGAVPQCGFSAAASSLYAGRIISLGTLLAIYLSTSDEMLPILISEKQPASVIAKILLTKVVIGMLAGFLVDLVISRTRRARILHGNHDRHGAHSRHGARGLHDEEHRLHEEQHNHIHEICEHEHCQCEKGIFRSAVSHTLQITVFIILITFVLNLFLHFVGEDALAHVILNRPVLGPLLAGLVGLVPNCASSIAITQLYLRGALSMGATMSGLLVGSGVGLLVLFRVNKNKKENLTILGLLYAIGVFVGIVLECM